MSRNNVQTTGTPTANSATTPSVTMSTNNVQTTGTPTANSATTPSVTMSTNNVQTTGTPTANSALTQLGNSEKEVSYINLAGKRIIVDVPCPKHWRGSLTNCFYCKEESGYYDDLPYHVYERDIPIPLPPNWDRIGPCGDDTRYTAMCDRHNDLADDCYYCYEERGLLDTIPPSVVSEMRTRLGIAQPDVESIPPTTHSFAKELATVLDISEEEDEPVRQVADEHADDEVGGQKYIPMCEHFQLLDDDCYFCYEERGLLDSFSPDFVNEMRTRFGIPEVPVQPDVVKKRPTLLLGPSSSSESSLKQHRYALFTEWFQAKTQPVVEAPAQPVVEDPAPSPYSECEIHGDYKTSDGCGCCSEDAYQLEMEQKFAQKYGHFPMNQIEFDWMMHNYHSDQDCDDEDCDDDVRKQRCDGGMCSAYDCDGISGYCDIHRKLIDHGGDCRRCRREMHEDNPHGPGW